MPSGCLSLSNSSNMPPKSSTLIPILASFAAVLVFGVIARFAIPERSDSSNTNMVACTDEAKLCPDGSYVGRTEPNCAFAECPTTNTNSNTNATNSSTPADCRPTGCSSQVCSDQEVVTDCAYRAEYACYQTATCERQENGECGWTSTPELQKCLQGALPD